MYKNLSIRSKIIVSVLGINIAVFIALFFIYYNFSSSVVEKETTEKAYSKMNESIAALESFLSEKEKIAWTVSELPLVKQWLAENEIRYVDKDNDPEFLSIAQLFRELAEKDKQINSVFISSEKTDMYYGTDPYPVDTTYKVTQRPWYVRAKEIGSPSFDISEDFSTKLIMVNSRIPIYDESGRLLGIGGCDINLKSFMRFVAELKIFETGKIYLLNNEGTYIFNPDSSKILSSNITDMKPGSVEEEDFNKTVGKIVSGETGFTEIQDDTDKYLFYTPIKSVNWTFVLTVDKDEINAPLSSLAEISVIIILASILLLGAAIFFTAGSVSKPIHNLTSGIMKAAKSGDLSFNAVVASKDDVGQLAESFNFLMSNLKLKADAAKEIANGNLAVNVEVISDMDLLGKSMLTMKESIKNVVDEINGFSDAALNGKLDWRADPTTYCGDYQKILLGINRTIDAILGPVNEASETLRRLANRDLRVRMKGDYRGDHARLKNTLNTAIQNLEDALTQVSHSIESNTNAADQITGLTDEISGSVTKQREETTEVAASIEEISSSIHETSRNAAATASTAEKAKTFAENGGKVVLNTIEGMKQIAIKVKQSADVVHTLGISSKEIGEIVNVINDIADQTNLLALNAAIEAARAGEQGRGFAIVADEVRKLAERTSKATQQIETMIKKIQKDTDLAVSSMEESKMDVDRGIKLADQAGDSLQQIVSISQAVTDKVNEISNANNEQASVSEQISFKIDNIEKLSHHTSESMMLINSHVQDFIEITRQLKLLNDRFILSGEVHSGEKIYSRIN